MGLHDCVSVSIEGGIKKLIADLQNGGTMSVGAGYFNKPHYATIATYLENGWVQRVTPRQTGWFRKTYDLGIKTGSHLVMPPRPFLAATLRAEHYKWASVCKAGFIWELNAYKVAQTVGGIMVKDIQATIASAGTSLEKFPERSPLTLEMYRRDCERVEVSEVITRDGRRKKTVYKPDVRGRNNMTTSKPLTLTGGLMQMVEFRITSEGLRSR